MIAGLLAAVGSCMLGAWLVMALVHAMHEWHVQTVFQRVLYLLAIVWLLLFGLFLTSVLGSVLEQTFL
jgi:hypothetical protein